MLSLLLPDEERETQRVSVTWVGTHREQQRQASNPELSLSTARLHCLAKYSGYHSDVSPCQVPRDWVQWWSQKSRELKIKICCSGVQSCLLSFCNPMDCSTSGFPVLHYLWEFVQTHVYWVNDAIQPSHLLSPFLFLPSIFPSVWVFFNESTLCMSNGL